ncbi:DUF6054 family protein [Paenibacillus eucommiae]|uniref:Uncharacterized protein n=1 Tax=Paenibacillus eucommiae TaxID=1355755 RepID=A0ABS4J6P9_9BACL|nr:DUF6054 family protein [Paenibacillus eucommiae]MBP1995510.1 hypothetical protein [Paenibacillus eucommiae]
MKGRVSMSRVTYNVSITPSVAMDLIKKFQYANADLVHEEYNEVDKDRSIGTLIYEKYYFRSRNRAALIVIIDNFKEKTNIRVIATGSSEGMILNFDWGAANNFVKSVEKILDEYIIE